MDPAKSSFAPQALILQIFAVTSKELLLLRRDRTGLLVLFLMPAILVVLITLVQENVMELSGQQKTRVLFLDLDQGELGSSLRQQLETGNLILVAGDEKQQDISEIQRAVTDGEYQVGIVVPEGASRQFKEEAARLFRQEIPATTFVQLFVDPGIMAGLRSGVSARLEMALTAIALEEKLVQLGGMLRELSAMYGVASPDSPLAGEQLATLFHQPLLLLDLQEGQGAAAGNGADQYEPVQQNVPAWALFGIFFTAIPIAGSILQERNSGIWIRLRALPVSPLVLFTGKALAYLGVCLCQFLLVALIGALIFPYLGLPPFSIATNPVAVLLVILLSALAACGYGIFLGMACNSYEQASTLGSTTVVAAAAIGGVMVPVYAMPGVMQQISILSPLNWGLTAFHDLLLRGAPLSAVLDDLGRLLLFFLVTALLSWKLGGIGK